MPSRVNGIGTGYVGKKHLEKNMGVCDNCKRSSMLENYETRLWFTVLFLPVIPLGRKQIINQCRLCTWHMAIPYHEWEKIRTKAVDETAAKWAENKDDPDAAIEMHGTLAAFNRREEANRLTEILLNRFGEVPKVQFYLGAWYERIGKDAEADACFERALQLAPDDMAARRAVAMGKIQQGEPAEARKLLVPMEPPNSSFEPGVFYQLANAFQKKNQHREALEIYKMVMKATPTVASDKEFRKAMRRSEKAEGIEVSQVPVDPFYKSVGFRWAAAIVAVAVAIFGWNFYKQTHRTVHIVNGLMTPITVQVDGGENVAVPAHSRREVKVSEGAHRAVVTDPAEIAPAVDFVVQSKWWERFFRDPAFVIDPARSAVLIWETTVYTDKPIPVGEEAPYEVYIGQPFVTRPDVDYHFTEFPQQLEVEGHNKRVEKSRIGLLEMNPVAALTATLPGQRGSEADLLTFAESHLRTKPDDKLLLAVYTAVSLQQQQKERSQKFIAARLDDRPVLIEWHRMYQQMRDSAESEQEMFRRYDDYLAKDPNNAALLYLRGRIENDPVKADELFDKSLAADANSSYPWLAKGYYRAVTGRFAEAKEAYEKAAKFSPDDVFLQRALYEARFALGEFPALEAELRKKLQETPLNVETHGNLLEVLVAAGQVEQAEAVHQEYAKTIPQKMPGDPLQLELQSKLTLHALRGEYDKVLEESRQLKTPGAADTHQFQARLELGQLDGPSPTSSGKNAYTSDLLTSLAWRQKGDAAKADEFRDKAVKTLSAGRIEERQAAALLAKDCAFDFADAERLTLDPAIKRIVLVAAAEGCEAQRAQLLALAEKLNFQREFPYHFLKRRIAALGTGK